MKSHCVYFFLILVAIVGCGSPSNNQEVADAPSSIRIAAASDLKFALHDLVKEFQNRQPTIQIDTSFGASGSLFAQLSNRAPFDMFFSADIQYPRKLIDQGDALRESLFRYAIGHIVLWVRNDSKLEIEKKGIDILKDGHVRKIAIANPKHAPYGRAAEAAMKYYGIYESVEERLVLGENVAQAAQFIESGSAEVGIIAMSLAMAPPLHDNGRYWPIPVESYPDIEQAGIILSWAKDRQACEKFRSFMLSQPGKAILKRYGFALPGDG